MNKLVQPSDLSQADDRFRRLLGYFSILIFGTLGLCWAGYSYTTAEKDPENKFAFLDEFVDEKEKHQLELSELRQRAVSPDSQLTEHLPAPEVTPRHLVSDAANDADEKINRPEHFYAAPLQIDVSNFAIEKRLARDAEYLSSDELEGRGIRTKGLVLAGDYLAEQFLAAELTTTWFNGKPFQEFQLLNGTRTGTVQRVMFHRPLNEKFLLTPNVDFSSLMKTTKGTMTLPVVFAGYGITAPELDYDDYAGIRVAGKAVIILRQEPQHANAASPFNGAESSRYAPVYSKIQNAISHGATAVILCDHHSETQQGPAEEPFSSDLLKVEFSEDAFDTTIPVIHCRRALLDETLQEFDVPSLAEIEAQIDLDMKPRSREIKDFKIGFEVARNRTGRTVRNVVASIEPNGMEPEKTIIVGAHYDHLGRDGWGSLAIGADGEIHNGADDNASGTSVIMEVARQLAARRNELKSRVLFVAFSAEELGLLGSKHYIRDPAVPLSKTKAMINLDMVGRLRDKITVYGMGTAREWNEIVGPSAEQNKLTIEKRSSGYGPSDHAVFYEKGIPVLHFFTGFHPQYHRPADDAHLLNIKGMRQISQCVTEIVLKISGEESALMPSTAGDDNILANGDYSNLLGEPDKSPPKFGVVVGKISSESGLQIRKVLPRSIAESHGLLPGDIIRKVGDDEIVEIKDLISSVERQSSGAKIPIYVKRRQLSLEIEISF